MRTVSREPGGEGRCQDIDVVATRAERPGETRHNSSVVETGVEAIVDAVPITIIFGVLS